MRYGADDGDGLAIGIDNSGNRVARATADLINVPDAVGRVASTGSGETKQHFFALTSDKFKMLLEKAENGNSFARGFGGELGMRGGKG